MTALSAMERAQTYAGFFVSLGDRWPSMVPADATVSGDTVLLQGVRMVRMPDGWRLTEGDTSCVVRPKVTAK